MTKLLFAAAIAAATLAGVHTPAAAQGYPDRPIRFILPFGPGGVADISARFVADRLGDKLGQRFIIENMPGGGGIAAARAVLSSPPDGYTLALLTNGTAISVPLFKSLPFDPRKDFVPVSTLGYFDCLLITNADGPYKMLADFIKAAREKPGALNVGTTSVGGTQNLTAELFKSTAGIDFTIVPFRTTPEAVVALLRNDIQMVVDFYAGLKPGLADNKTRAVAWTGAKRSPAMPDVPTALEQGVAGFEVSSWNALYAPAGTPQPIIDKLNATMREVLAEPELKRKLLDLGIDSRASAPAEMDTQMRADIAKWTAVIEKANIPRQ